MGSRVSKNPYSALLLSVGLFARFVRSDFDFVPLTSADFVPLASDIPRPMHLCLPPEIGKYKFRGVRMEILVTTFSNGKDCSKDELFAESLLKNNVKPIRYRIAGKL